MVPQQPAATLGGLFGDDSKQIDLEDLIHKAMEGK
jgi:hypothetical protein